MVPMHLVLIDEPFVPCNLISTQDSPVPLLKFQVAPRLKILMSSGSQKETQMYFFFSLESPGKQTPSEFPKRALWREISVYTAFCISLENLIKIPLNKKALRKKRPSMFPKSGAPMEADAHFRALLIYLSRSPVKEPSFKASFIKSLAQKCPVPKVIRSSFRVPGIRAPFRIPSSPRL